MKREQKSLDTAADVIHRSWQRIVLLIVLHCEHVPERSDETLIDSLCFVPECDSYERMSKSCWPSHLIAIAHVNVAFVNDKRGDVLTAILADFEIPTPGCWEITAYCAGSTILKSHF